MDRKSSLLRRDDISPVHRLVAMTLIDAEDERGVVSGVRQKDIATIIGLRREYVAWILRDLRDKGVIAFDHVPHHPGVYRFVGEYAPEGVVA